MIKPAILAPVGGQEQLLAAVRCGADAVYLGSKSFNARRNASNFDSVGLADAVRYCHERGVKVSVAVNTLVLDEELPALEAEAETIAASGADSVILQDMAAARLFSARWPKIRRIASTQTAVHNSDGARFLEDAGFQSFVLARELTLDEMKKICSAVSMDAEAFVHGAHCMSLSGACYLSAMLGGRSGNRGLCAQPCRLDWQCGQCHNALSLKDMSLIGHIQALSEAGVSYLKIEGRMKRPEYVAAAVTACKAARAGQPYDADALRAVFSRSGFTDGYLTGTRDASMFGSRTKEDVTGAEGVLTRLAGLYHKELPLVPVDMTFLMTDSGTKLTVSDGVHTVSAAGKAPEPALTRPLDETAAQNSLTKTGGTQYYVNHFSASLVPGMMLPASALNAMRREALLALDALRGAITPQERGLYQPPRPSASKRMGKPPLYARFRTPEQIIRADALARIILPAEHIDRALLQTYGERLIAQLPAVLFPDDEDALEARLLSLRDAGLKAVWTDNIYGIKLAARLGLAAHGGFGLNVTNTEAVDFYDKLGLTSLTVSFEPSMSQLQALGGKLCRGVAAYGYLPLMRYRNCPVRAAIGCAACGGHGSLTDRKGLTFPVECGERRYSTLLNSVPLHIAELDVPADYRLLYFTVESQAQCGDVIADFLAARKSPLPRTRGLYFRELQ